MDSAFSPIIRAKDVVCGYGRKEVLHGIDLEIGAREVVALLGHNASGKSTLLKALFGVIPLWTGELQFAGRVVRPSPKKMAALGALYVPQGNVVFPDLTVIENIQVRASVSTNGAVTQAAVDEAMRLFPALKPLSRRHAGTLSGGEKQMLALASAIVLRPMVLALDEPSLGLAPGSVAHVFEYLQRMNDSTGIALVIVEQKVREVLRIAHRACVLRSGRITFDGRPEELHDGRLAQVFL